MKIADLSGPLKCIFFLPLLAVAACGQTVPQRTPSVRTTPAEAMVASFYGDVITRQPIADMGDPKVFAPYFSKALLHRFADNTACFADWDRQHPGTTDKPPFGQLEMGLYSGANERSHPSTFQIVKTESRADGSSRVYVKLAYITIAPTEPTLSNRDMWSVAAVVVREDNRPVIDDVIYLKDDYQYDEERLSQILGAEYCKGPRWEGPPGW